MLFDIFLFILILSSWLLLFILISTSDIQNKILMLIVKLGRKKQQQKPYLFIYTFFLPRVQEEIDSIVGDKEFVEYQDVMKMEYSLLVRMNVDKIIPLTNVYKPSHIHISMIVVH